jgi:alpha-L-fucosidase
VITRRRFLEAGGLALCAASGERFLRVVQNGDPAARLAKPSADQIAWADLEIGMFVHFAPNTWQNLEYDARTTPLSEINPHIDTDQWAECAANLGAKYIVFVAKHAGGFCMWQTNTTDYSIRSTLWRGGNGDVMREISRSCEKRGLKLGAYLSPRDDNFGAAHGGKCATPEKQEAYDAMYREQLTELVSRYQPLVEIWFDGNIVVPVGDILAKHARHSMIFQGPHATIRWVGNEDGMAPYPAWNGIRRAAATQGESTVANSDPDGDAWLPNEVDVSVRRPDWFWHTDNEKKLLTLDSLLDVYYRSVGRGAQLLLNFPPNRDGKIPDADFARAKEFGDEIRRRFGKSAAEKSGTGARITLTFVQPVQVDHVILEEDLADGERVREFTIHAAAPEGGWRRAGGGTAIGHKRILPIESQVARELRLSIEKSVGEPRIRRFAAFATGAAPPASWNS